MPQMSHLMWLYLFMFFSIMLMFSLIKSYFLHTPSTEGMTNQNYSSKMNLQWMW